MICMTKSKDEPRIVFAPAVSDDRLRERLELRRSSAASKHRNKAKYHRPTEKRNHDR
jgi:hypothetical protein